MKRNLNKVQGKVSLLTKCNTIILYTSRMGMHVNVQINIIRPKDM
jgi:hypothetical protein